MAFNFNWTPLAADDGFYERARELLTNALNRGGGRPAIIVDDILVHELNLGDVPPELELLEIGDLGEDRFRGTFKMSYEGNALISLKTKVEANPLNTYLHIRPAFASPQPLAAATSLQIPLQITLSDFRLSGIITLVFSRQKGLTLVSRNDNLLRSVRVSSTFDSISFVANYLQKEIEGQLRILLTDELPAIIHRLSLRLWTPEHKAREDEGLQLDHNSKDEVIIDPFASPPQDPVDANGQVLSPAQVASLSLDSSVETQSLFSQKNLIRLASLTDSQRTLSLFTPSIRDVVFRAWTGPLERGDPTPTFSRSTTPALSRSQSFMGNMIQHAYTYEGSSTRPTLYSFPSAPHSVGSLQGRLGKGHPGRKRKKRVVDLRKKTETSDGEMISEDGSTAADTASVTNSESTAPSIFSAPPATISSGAERAHELITPPRSPLAKRDGGEWSQHTIRRRSTIEVGESSQSGEASSSRIQPLSPTRHRGRTLPSMEDRNRTIRVRDMQASQLVTDADATPKASMYLPEKRTTADRRPRLAMDGLPPPRPFHEASPDTLRNSVPNFVQFIADPANGGSIAERAWMMKIASEVARRYEEDQRAKGSFGVVVGQEEETTPPPAYAQ